MDRSSTHAATPSMRAFTLGRLPVLLALCCAVACSSAQTRAVPPAAAATDSGSVRILAADVRRFEVRFPCAELRCAAWLYLPPAASAPDSSKPPVIVMAHGFGGTRALFLPSYAERFARGGFAVFVFDYRSFGDSEGEPRQVVRIESQLEDWRDALRHVRARSDVDVSRLALWGTSLSGGHVLNLAAQDRDVRAVVAQVPYVDSEAGASASFGFRLRALWAIARDRVRRSLGLSPLYIPVIASPDAFGAINSADAFAAAERLIPPSLGWRNEIAASALLELAFYRPVERAREIEASTLLLPAREDELIPLETVRALASKMRRAELRELEGGHFDSYGGPLLDVATDAQLEFLTRVLAPDVANLGEP